MGDMSSLLSVEVWREWWRKRDGLVTYIKEYTCQQQTFGDCEINNKLVGASHPGFLIGSKWCCYCRRIIHVVVYMFCRVCSGSREKSGSHTEDPTSATIPPHTALLESFPIGHSASLLWTWRERVPGFSGAGPALKWKRHGWYLLYWLAPHRFPRFEERSDVFGVSPR